MQGDSAIRHVDGAFTFHGRSDEVINVGGNRIGTAEIEGALLIDTARAINHYIHLCSFSLLGECSYRASITPASLRHRGSAIQNDYFQKLPNQARKAAHSLFLRVVSSALLGATAAFRHGRA